MESSPTGITARMADFDPDFTPPPSATQVVLNAVDALYEEDIPEDRCIMATTLRAAAGCIVDLTTSTDYTYWDGGHEVGVNRAAILLLAIADELENNV